jgi:hypothetical protein
MPKRIGKIQNEATERHARAARSGALKGAHCYTRIPIFGRPNIWATEWDYYISQRISEIRGVKGGALGGCGSGRHKGVTKRRVESCLALDVNELRRMGALTPGASGTLTWDRGGDAEASVAFCTESTALILCFHDQCAAEPRDVEQYVALTSVPVAFGGSRVYLLCPGAECGRRVSVLYFRRGEGVFRCRHCQGLAYESQREDARKRARRRADKLRARLRLPQRRPLALPILIKPKGMWSRTFERLRGHAIAAESVATAAQVAHWVRLLRRVNRRQRQSETAERGD